MPRISLRLEVIGDNIHAEHRLYSGLLDEANVGLGRAILGKCGWCRPWVAEIVGTCKRYGLNRSFVRGQKSYRDTNSNGSRGVYLYYWLHPGRVYEVYEMISWRGRDRYMLATWGGVRTRITQQEAVEWARKKD